MEDLLVISGPPGSGKSTVAELIAGRMRPSVLVEGDAFFRFLRGGIEPWMPEAEWQNERVVDAAGAAAGRFASEDLPVVYDGVLGPWHLEAFVAATGLEAIDYAVLLPSLPATLLRVAQREDHPFDDRAAAQHMHREFATAGIEDRHVFTSTAAPHDVVDEIALARSLGSLRVAR